MSKPYDGPLSPSDDNTGAGASASAATRSIDDLPVSPSVMGFFWWITAAFRISPSCLVQWIKNYPDDHFRYFLRTALTIAFLVAGAFYALKASDDRSAFMRWRGQVLQLDDGVNIYDEMLFPTPPIMPIMLYPLMKLPPLVGALAWFTLKSAMAVISVGLCLSMAKTAGKAAPGWVEGLVWLLALRPVLGDLHHGNNNLLIVFLITLAVYWYQRGRAWSGGIVLGLAITSKITPALFLPYFVYKRAWTMVAGSVLGLALFFVVVPSVILGPSFNQELLTTWWNRIIRPYVSEGVVGAQEVNQSMVGVMNRLLSDGQVQGRYGARMDLNVASWDPLIVGKITKGLSLGFVALLVWLCRTRTSRADDPRLLGEYALVVLTMLFVSERSWKHHYVTIILPVCYLCSRLAFRELSLRDRSVIAAALGIAWLMMASTSSEFGYLIGLLFGLPAVAFTLVRLALSARRIREDEGLGMEPPFIRDVVMRWVSAVLAVAVAVSITMDWGMGLNEVLFHKYAQGYGMFFWAGFVLYLAAGWRLWAERTWETLPLAEFPQFSRLEAGSNAIPAPHGLAGASARQLQQSGD